MLAGSRNPCKTSAESMQVTRVSLWYDHEPCRLSRSRTSRERRTDEVGEVSALTARSRNPSGTRPRRERFRRWRGLADQGQRVREASFASDASAYLPPSRPG